MLPRGIRNNNPLNIKIGNDWQGEVERNTDGVFEQFTEAKYGYRAAMIILRKYITKYQRDTIRKIVNSWAPDGEPYQTNYIKSVSARMQLDPDTKLDFYNRDHMLKLVHAMACVENGCAIDPEPIADGYRLACQYP